VFRGIILLCVTDLRSWRIWTCLVRNSLCGFVADQMIIRTYHIPSSQDNNRSVGVSESIARDRKLRTALQVR
jgi:hypothetical protein